MISTLLVLASLMGAAGVVLAAAAAHAAPGAGLDSAAYLLLFHAVAVLGAAALAQQGLLWPPAGARRHGRLRARRRAVRGRRFDAGVCRAPAVPDGGAGRRHDPHHRLAGLARGRIVIIVRGALTPLSRPRHTTGK